jgi:hypothetical protein
VGRGDVIDSYSPGPALRSTSTTPAESASPESTPTAIEAATAATEATAVAMTTAAAPGGRRGALLADLRACASELSECT